MKKIRFIINPISGIGRQKKVEKTVEKFLDKSLFNFDIAYTKEKGHATELSKEASKNGYDIVVAVGGDGSINECALGVISTSTALGAIPTGSGNGLARFLGLPFNLEKAITSFNDYQLAQIDTATLNGHLFTSIAGIGFDGLIAQKLTKIKIRGFWGYFKSIIEEYATYDAIEYTLHMGDCVMTTRALMIAFANSNQFGYDTIVSNDAKINDGLIDVCIVKKIPVISAPLVAQNMFLKNMDKTIYIDIIRAKEITIKTKNNNFVNIDGEPLELGKEIVVKVQPNALTFAMPRKVATDFEKKSKVVKEEVES